MEVVTIAVERRDVSGTNKVRKLRQNGRLPMMLYGRGQEPTMLAADYDEVRRHLAHHRRVYQLQMGQETQAGYLKEVQWDVLTDEPLHVDFLRIEMHEPLKLQVDLRYLGHAKGVASGGRLMQDHHTVQLLCLPDRIPEDIPLRVDALEIGDRILARDLELPEGCQLDMPADASICHVMDERKKILAEEAAAAAAAEAVAAGTAAAAGPAPAGEGKSPAKGE